MDLLTLSGVNFLGVVSAFILKLGLVVAIVVLGIVDYYIIKRVLYLYFPDWFSAADDDSFEG